MPEEPDSWAYIMGRACATIAAVVVFLLVIAAGLSIMILAFWWLFDQVLIPFYQYLRLG